MSAPGPVVPPSRAPRTGKARIRSLADDLRSRDDDAIATLLRARPDLLHPVPADLSALSTRATTSTSVARALDRLDRGALGVLEALAALPEPTRLTDLAAGLRAVPRRQLTATVGRLRELALLWGTDRALHLVRSVRQAFGDHPAGLGPALADTRRGVRPYAADPGLAARVLATAPADASTALQQLLWGPPVGFLPGADRQVSADTATTAVEWLLARSLLEPLDASTVVVPREVALPLRDGVLVADVALAAPEVRVAAQHDPARVDRTAAQQAFETTRAVAALLSLWSSSPPARLRSGGLGVRDLTRTAASLDLPEARTALLVELCHAAGLLASDGEIGESWCPTPAYDQWLERPAAAQWAVLAQTWLSMTRLPGLGTGPEAAEPRPNLLSRELDHPGAPDLRRATLEVFDRLPTGAAPDPADLFSLLAWSRPRGAVQRRRAMAATTLQEAEQLGVTGLGALSCHGAALLRAAVADEASTEGRAAARAPGRAPVPAEVVDALDPLLPEPLDHILLQADLTAVAPGPLELGLARELALLADVESTGGATVYRFTESSVRRALDAGRSASDLLSLLTTRSRTALPQPLEYLIHDTARRHGAIRVGIASAYVRCDDPVLLTALFTDRHTASLGLTRLADTVLAAQSPPEVVLERLRAAGFVPSAESADGSVLTLRPHEHRTPTRPRPPRLAAGPPAPNEAMVGAAVRALRAGEKAAANRPPILPAGNGSGRLPRSSTASALVELRAALAEQRAVWIGYADSSGTTTERVVEPLRLDGGFLTGYDLRTAQVRTFTVARITAVAPVAPHPSG